MTLKIYAFVIETLRLLAPVMREIAEHDGDLARQMRRAASSVALNLSEGAGNDGGNRRLRFRTAAARRRRHARVSRCRQRSST